MSSNPRWVTFLIWSVPVPAMALVTGLGLMRGIDHEWLQLAHLVLLTLSPVTSLLAVAFCSVLVRRLESTEQELQITTSTLDSTKEQHRLLEDEVDKLSGMREIQMSSHIEGFSELVKSTLDVVLAETNARSLTIFLESQDEPGVVYPKAHLRMEPQTSPLHGEGYLFFEEEILLSQTDRDWIDGFSLKVVDNTLPLKGDVYHGGRQVGGYEAPVLPHLSPEQVKDQAIHHLNHLDITIRGVVPCWTSRGGNTVTIGPHVFFNIPVFSQNIIIGVLQAELAGIDLQPEDHDRVQSRLKAYSLNIGQPLKKEQLYEQAIKDALTGLFNKSSYGLQLNDHFYRCQRYGNNLTYIFLDIDHFKHINDTYGHLTGDIALKSVSRIIRDNIRQSDIAFRFGGEELCVLLPESDENDGVAVAEKLRKVIEETKFPTDQDFTIRFTASFGVACSRQSMKDPSQLANAADQAVYHAKRSGRNRVVAYSELEKEKFLTPE